MSKNIAIFTCITGDYEFPTEGFEKKDGYDYYLFCDKIINVKSWKLMIPRFNDDPKLNDIKKQRMVKTHPHWVLPDYDITVWIDANTEIDQKLYDYIEKNKDNNITFKNHPDRNCIYDELKECVFWGKETVSNGQYLYNRYMKEKFPKHIGLYETNIIISHPKNKSVIRLYDAWWKQIYEYSHRDQLSLNYIIWKNGLLKYIKSVDSKDFPPKAHKKIENDIQRSGDTKRSVT